MAQKNVRKKWQWVSPTNPPGTDTNLLVVGLYFLMAGLGVWSFTVITLIPWLPTMLTPSWGLGWFLLVYGGLAGLPFVGFGGLFVALECRPDWRAKNRGLFHLFVAVLCGQWAALLLGMGVSVLFDHSNTLELRLFALAASGVVAGYLLGRARYYWRRSRGVRGVALTKTVGRARQC